MFYTIHWMVGGLRADFARFTDQDEAKRAIARLLHVRHALQPIRITMRHAGETIYSFERK